ncbi:MAG: GAF domain-containing protein [Flavobacteriaceae bacterium]|nr:GAF domain-containing protein [Flavobacteriaceae bacterium]
MKSNKREFPLDMEISFKKLIDTYREHLEDTNPLVRDRAEKIVAIADEYPILVNGLAPGQGKDYQEQINVITQDLFPEVLQNNEIKIATSPFKDDVFRSTARYKRIMEEAGDDYELELTNFSEDQYYLMGCSIILQFYYGKHFDFRRPFYYQIPDDSGIMRFYKVLYNADFVSIEKKPETKDISEEDLQALMDNFDNIKLWKKIIPPNSWKFSGFVIANMFDATADVSLSDFKSNLIQKDTKEATFAPEFKRIMRSLFGDNELEVGFTLYNKEDDEFLPTNLNTKSYILEGKDEASCEEALCDKSYYTLFKKKAFYCISDVPKFAKEYPDNTLYAKLLRQDVKSAIITPVGSDDEIYGMLEIVSPQARALNSINANKLHDIMPFLIDSVKRSKETIENEIELLIQEECTSIHPSVHWKFRREAHRVLKAQNSGFNAYFREIVFEGVYPLYGQIDIKESSNLRNQATIKDLVLQLEYIQTVIDSVYKIEALPIYQQMAFRIEQYLETLHEELQVNSEKQVQQFIRKEVVPLFNHLRKKNDNLKKLIQEYYEMIDMTSGLVYKHRKDYDESVMQVNKKLAAILDKNQMEAQHMYPHYYERFKTDGVEHNMYIGESITRYNTFHKIYLYNLRLWQLQVMCEMENQFYRLKEELPIPMDVASMILSFNSPLALRFRMDEKRFDVDGTYNARYEVVKKRVDKANIKGTDERITQAGKITIVYSQQEDEQEYMKYVSFLQKNKRLNNDVEILELEDLQGVTGLKAIRVGVIYSKQQDNEKKYYTYEDLMEEINTQQPTE